MTCVLITHVGYKCVCKEESYEDDNRDILKEETALMLLQNIFHPLGPYQLYNL